MNTLLIIVLSVILFIIVLTVYCALRVASDTDDRAVNMYGRNEDDIDEQVRKWEEGEGQ